MQSHIKIKGKTLDNWLHFYLSELRVLAEDAGCKSYFALTLLSQNQHFHKWRDMLMKYSLLKYSKFILGTSHYLWQGGGGVGKVHMEFHNISYGPPFILNVSCSAPLCNELYTYDPLSLQCMDLYTYLIL